MIQKNYFLSKRNRKTFAVFLFLSFLIVPFQNCKKFEATDPNTSTNESSSSTDPSTSNGNGNNSGGSGATGGGGSSSGGGGASGGGSNSGSGPIDMAKQKALCESLLTEPKLVTGSSMSSNVSYKHGLMNNGDSESAVINLSFDTANLNALSANNCSYTLQTVCTFKDDVLTLDSARASSDNFVQMYGSTSMTAKIGENLIEKNPSSVDLKKAIRKDMVILDTVCPNTVNGAKAAIKFLPNRTNINNAKVYNCVKGQYKVSIKGRLNVAAFALQKDSTWEHVALVTVDDSCKVQQTILPDTLLESRNNFGKKVAISGDWLASTSEKLNNGAVTSVGAVFVYKKDTSGTYTQTQKIILPSAASGDLVSSIAFGNGILFIGASYHDNNGVTNNGRVSAYKLSGETWNHAYDLMLTTKAPTQFSNNSTNPLFGYSIAVDGNNLFISAPGYHYNNGLVSYYSLDASLNASFVKNLYPHNKTPETLTTDEIFDLATPFFGASISAASGKLLVGAPVEVNYPNNGNGAAYYFANLSSTSGTKIAYSFGNATGARFGESVQLNIAADGKPEGYIAAPYHDEANSNNGAVAFINNLDSASLSIAKIITGTTGADAFFGSSIKLSANNLFISSPNLNGGQIFQFRKNSNGAYALVDRVVSYSTLNIDQFGSALEFNGKDLIIGARNKNVMGGTENGAIIKITITNL